MTYNRKDHYYRKAKEEGKASRAAYKISQLQERFNLIKQEFTVIDLGCAPGGWLIEISNIVGPKGKVIGIDLLPLKIGLPQNVTFIQGNIEDPDMVSKLKMEITGEANVVVSDMAPNTSGVAFRDAYLSFELCTMALEIAKSLLKKGGGFITKIFMGEEVKKFKEMLSRNFGSVTQVIPPATRKGSREIYLVATSFKK